MSRDRSKPPVNTLDRSNTEGASATIAAAWRRSARAGAVALTLALGASLVLALDHLGALQAPGCGLDGACARAARSALGSIPGLGWPTAFVGVAWFAALLAAHLSARGRWTSGFRLVAHLGVLASLVLLAALFLQDTPCPWCMGVHAANVAFWWFGLRAPRVNGPTARAPWTVLALVFAATTGALVVAQRSSDAARRATAEAELARSMAELKTAPTRGDAAFTGRWRRGPERARARVVVFTDYQCPDCKRVEEELELYAAAHADVALSVKHFPMCPQCNANAPDMHPNACWAARAAEAAGASGGIDGFWRMHRWLFARSGSFTKEELEPALPGLGFDVAAFVQALNAPASLAPITADVAEAMQLGLARTPMVFVNGVELRGWDAEGAITRALESVRDDARDAAADRPAGAREKILGDWRAESVKRMPPDRFPRVLGRADARVVITLFGDFLDEFTVTADRAARAQALAHDDVRYEYRHFPTNQACNPVVPRTIHKLACLAAMGAEASAQVQESAGFWTMHDWLMEHRVGFDDAVLQDRAVEMGMERPLFWEVLQAQEILDAIYDDVLAAKELGVESIPAIWVNEKRLARWQLEGEDLFPVVIEEARALPR
ncbi:MAG: thioredoxin domain-containing protein [Planctomycetes bacterium]|nr:thioredoxin domain-containing protein [Planctomycetota bacterium]